MAAGGWRELAAARRGRDGRVRRVDRAVPPRRVRVCLGARRVIECAAGQADTFLDALGAAGALEFVVTMHAMRDQIAPPTINFAEPDEKCPVDAIPNEARPLRIQTAMSNSFAFGGINAVLVIKGIEAA